MLATEPELHEGEAEIRCTMLLAVPRHARGGQREPGVFYVPALTFGLEARDCAERLHRGDRIGLTGRLEQDEYFTPKGERRIDHSVLIDQLDWPPEGKPQHEEEQQ